MFLQDNVILAPSRRFRKATIKVLLTGEVGFVTCLAQLSFGAIEI